MMKKAAVPLLCLVLPFCFTVAGCSNVSQRVHDQAGNIASVKVFPFYVDADGEKLVVPGLDVGLFPERRGRAMDVRIATTEESGPLVFDGLVPGEYLLKIYLKGRKIVKEDLELRAGKRVTVRIDFVGIDSWQRFINKLEAALAAEFFDLAEEIITHLLDSLTDELFEEDLDDDDESGGSGFDWKGDAEKSKPVLRIRKKKDTRK